MTDTEPALEEPQPYRELPVRDLRPRPRGRDARAADLGRGARGACARAAQRRGVRLRRRRRRRRAHDARQPRGVRALAIVPRMLRDVSQRDLATSVLGTALPAPVLLAPVGVQSIVHPDAELAVGRAAAAHGLPAILSTAASNTLEDVAAAMEPTPPASRWYQLYWPRERELAASFVGRAGRRRLQSDRRHARHLAARLAPARPRRTATCRSSKARASPTTSATPSSAPRSSGRPEEDPGPAIGHWAYQFANPSVTWADLAWLREQTDAADRAQGDHPRRRRAPGARGRRRRR